MENWLKRGALRYALYESPPAIEEVQLEGRPRFFRSGLESNPTLAMASCIAGSSDFCDRVFFGAERAEGFRPTNTMERARVGGHLPKSYVGTGDPAYRDENLYMASLFTELEREFGADAFGEFWRSDRDPNEAFAAAFGVDGLDWFRGWAEGKFGELRGGPTLRATTAGLLIPVMVLTMLLSAFVAVRRRMN